MSARIKGTLESRQVANGFETGRIESQKTTIVRDMELFPREKSFQDELLISAINRVVDVGHSDINPRAVAAQQQHPAQDQLRDCTDEDAEAICRGFGVPCLADKREEPKTGLVRYRGQTERQFGAALCRARTELGRPFTERNPLITSVCVLRRQGARQGASQDQRSDCQVLHFRSLPDEIQPRKAA